MSDIFTSDYMGEPQPGAPAPQEKPEPTEARRKLAGELCQKVKDARGYHKDNYKRMREDMELVQDGSTFKSFKDGKKYVANIIQRHVAQRVSALYAKNPRAVAERRERRDFRVWDGDM